MPNDEELREEMIHNNDRDDEEIEKIGDLSTINAERNEAIPPRSLYK